MPVVNLRDLPDQEPVQEVSKELTLESLPDQVQPYSLEESISEVEKLTPPPYRLPRWDDIKTKLPAGMASHEADIKDALSIAAAHDITPNAAYQIQKEYKEGVGETDLWDQAQGSLKAGMGDVYVGMGNALKWGGMDEDFADVYVDYGERMRDAFIPPSDPSEFTWRKTLDPEWWATTVTRSVPFTLSLVPAAVVGAYAGAGVLGAAATTAGLGTFGTSVLTSLGGATGAAALSRPLEAAFEASSVYAESLERGDTEAEANIAADRVFAGNMKLLGLDAAQYAMAFSPLKFGKGLKPSLMRRMAAGAGALSTVAVTEAGEERYQEYLQMEAMGVEANFFDFDNPRMNEASTIGGIFGLGMGGAGSVWKALTRKATDTMPEDVKKTFDDVRKESIGRGLSEDKATLAGLDAVAATPEGEEHINKVVNDMKTKAEEGISMEAPAEPVITAPTMEELMEKLQAEDLTEEELGGLLDQFAGGREIIEEVQAEPVAEIRERLLATGMDEAEATANAALFDGFRVLAQRAGVSVDDLMERYLPEVAREGVEEVAAIAFTDAEREAVTNNPFLQVEDVEGARGMSEEELTDEAKMRSMRDDLEANLITELEAEETLLPEEEITQMKEAVEFLDARIKTIRETPVGEVLEQAPTAPAPAFFSKLENVITEKMQKKASAQDILNLIKKGDVKAEEIKWSGIEDYLKGKKTVTKDEVLEYLQANQIEVTEVEKGLIEKGDELTPEENARFDELTTLSREDNETSEELAELNELRGKKLDALQSGKTDTTKFSEYTLPGGENYKELLLTLPVSEEGRIVYTDENIVPIEPGTDPAAQDGKRFWYFRSPDNVFQILKSQYATEEEAKQHIIKNKQPEPAAGETFVSGHFDEPNILAHVRFNERTDAEGNKVLFLEEVQSDWALEARKKGIKDPSVLQEYTDLSKRFNELSEQEKERYFDLRDSLEVQREGVPAAPFIQKNWHELALKRMLRYAAANGFDKVAWISGEQTADRYDLSKKVDVVDYKASARQLVAKDSAGNEVIREQGVTENDLERYVGKELAQRLIEKGKQKDIVGHYRLEGQELKVGGEWAFTLYDKVIPNFLKKYGKKWGAKVGKSDLGLVSKTISGETEIPSGRPLRVVEGKISLGRYTIELEDGDFWGAFNDKDVAEKRLEVLKKTYSEEKISQQSIPITDEMKEAVLGEGQPLFQPTQEGIAAAGPRGQIRIAPEGVDVTLFKDADQSTFVHETGHLYFRMMADLSTLPSASEELKTDFETLKTWLNYEEGQVGFSVDQQEQFARGFEAYLREGKAPSSALAEAFENFKQWLMQIYKSLRDLNVELTDEVRGVMDRMLADEGVVREEVLEQAPIVKQEVIEKTKTGFDFKGQSKVRSSDVFANAEKQPSREVREKADVLIEAEEFNELPEVDIPVSRLIPTQRFIHATNLERVKASTPDTNAFVVKDGEDYYVLDGHHRVAVNIVNEEPVISAHLLDVAIPEEEVFEQAAPAPQTFQPREVTQADMPESIAGEKITNHLDGTGQYYHATSENLQAYLDAHGDGFLYRIGNKLGITGLGAERVDGGSPGYLHKFKGDNEQKTISLSSSLEDTKKELDNRKEAGTLNNNTIVYRVLPEDVASEFAVQIPSYKGKKEELLHVHAPVSPRTGEAELIFVNGEFQEEALTDDSKRAFRQQREQARGERETDIRLRPGARPEGRRGAEVLEQAAAKITNIRQLAKSLGGIDFNREHLKGELNKLKEDAPATRLIINKRDDGVTLDRLRESAIEAGILTEEATLDDVLSALEVNLQTAEVIEEDIAKDERIRSRIEEREFESTELKEEFIKVSQRARKAFREGKAAGVAKEVQKLKNILARTRKLRIVRDYLNLTDADMKKLTTKNPLLMDQWEFKKFIDDLRVRAVELSENKLQKAMLIHMIHSKDLSNVDNYRKVLGLPAITKMTTEQAQEFAEALEPFADGSSFLTVRQLQLIDRTELEGARTYEEAKATLSEKTGMSIEDLSKISITEWTKFKWDTALAESDPFLNLLVRGVNEKLLEANIRAFDIETKVHDLAKKSEKSRPRTFIEKIIPQDKLIFQYLESPADEKADVMANMTKEQLDLAHYMQEYFSNALEYLIKVKGLEQGRENYITHVRRGMLENIKEEGLSKAVKSMFTAMQEDYAVFNIGTDQHILPLDKFFQYEMRRTGVIAPSENVIKVFLQYVNTFEKMVSLNEIMPVMDIYAQSITPQKYTPKGLEMDKSIKNFVHDYINNKKGRRITAAVIDKQGGVIDISLRAGKAVTSFLDLGWNIFSGLAATGGEQITNYQMLGVKRFAKGNKRIGTKKGKAILEKYAAVIGRSSWEGMFAPGEDIMDRTMTSAFALFNEATRLSNSQFLLGSITDSEYNKGEISSGRMTELLLDMGRFRVVPGTKSLVGSTSIGGTLTQYKTWAIPVLRTNLKNLIDTGKNLKNRPIGEALSQREAIEIYRLVGITLTAYIVWAMAGLDEEDDSFAGQLLNKVKRETFTLIQAVDPTLFFGDPRLSSFLQTLAKNIKMSLFLEEYKTKQGFKGIEGLKKQLTPRAVKQFIPKPKKKERL